MTDETGWMDHVRWSYLNQIRLAALRKGFALVRVGDEGPVSELEGYTASEWGCEGDEACLYLLLNQQTGEKLFAEGTSIGLIEDYLADKEHAAG